nr:MAG TPA: hypothetical protein [Caudoviricetes sp.]
MQAHSFAPVVGVKEKCLSIQAWYFCRRRPLPPHHSRVRVPVPKYLPESWHPLGRPNGA